MSTEELIGVTTTTPSEVLAPATTGNIVPMSQAAPAVLRAPFNYRPGSFESAVKLADMLASSDLVPKDYRGKSANCFVAMQWGHELDMNPLQAVQSIAVINGKPGLYGDAGKAVLLSKGCQIEEADAAEIKETNTARCTIKRTGRAPVTRTFSIEDAQKAGLWNRDGPWKNYPFRMLAWRAFWNAARDAAADLLKGMGGVEELADIIEPTASAPAAPRVAPPKAKAPPSDDAEDRQAGKGGTASTGDEDGTVVPASPAMLAHVRKVLARGELSGSDVHKRFDDIPESLEGMSVAQVNRVLAWSKDPTK